MLEYKTNYIKTLIYFFNNLLKHIYKSLLNKNQLFQKPSLQELSKKPLKIIPGIKGRCKLMGLEMGKVLCGFKEGIYILEIGIKIFCMVMVFMYIPMVKDMKVN